MGNTDCFDKNSQMVTKASSLHSIYKTFEGISLDVAGVDTAVCSASFTENFL